MIVLHLHEIVARPEVQFDDMADDGQPKRFAPETRRGAAECVAKVWPSEDPRSDPVYWSSLYNFKTPFEDISEMPPHLADQMSRFVEELKCHPMVLDAYHKY